MEPNKIKYVYYYVLQDLYTQKRIYLKSNLPKKEIYLKRNLPKKKFT